MPRPGVHGEAMPSFRSAAEKRAWLLEQLAAVEREAILEEMVAGRNERVSIRVGSSFHIDVGHAALYSGSDAAGFAAALAGVIEALPLGSTFVVEAGKGGKVLSGGVGTDEGLMAGQEAAAPARRGRRPKGEPAA